MNNGSNGSASIEEFIEQIINEKGYTTLDEETKNTLKQDMAQRLMDQIDQAAIDALSEDKAVELSEKMESMTEDEVAQFMKDAGVDLDKIAMTTMLQFRMLYLGETEG